MRSGMLGLSLVALAAVGNIAFPLPPKDLARAPAAKDDARLIHFAPGAWVPQAVTDEIARSFRDQPSTVFGAFDLYFDVTRTRAILACGDVNTKNAFGGYTGMTKFVAVLGSGITLVDLGRNNHSPAQRLFVNTWNKMCVGRPSRRPSASSG
ncbi:MAG: hypothetical protein ACREC9_13580 [Methylocella sp.]